MIPIEHTLAQFQQGAIDKPTFIKTMYEAHHAALFDYAAYIGQTNVRKIEIEDGKVIMTSRDRGIRIACTPGDYRVAPMETLNFFDYEKEESAMMEQLVADGDNFLDIGANIGWYSINLASSRRAATVYAFEPVPVTYAKLQENLALNASSNIKAHNFGLSEQAGEFTFYYPPEGSGNASAVNLTGRGDVRTAQCEVRTLDGFTAATGTRVDFIKCDVEGAELLVFKGGLRTIARDQPSCCRKSCANGRPSSITTRTRSSSCSAASATVPTPPKPGTWSNSAAWTSTRCRPISSSCIRKSTPSSCTAIYAPDQPLTDRTHAIHQR